MKKKVFSVLLTVALATGVLAGCGSSAATGNNAATGAAQNEGSQTASATTAGEESGDTIVIRSCFATGMTGAVNRFAIEKGLYKELGIEFENVEASADTNSPVLFLAPEELLQPLTAQPDYARLLDYLCRRYWQDGRSRS